MKILGIETSCDETGAAVVERNDLGSISILSNIIATSSEMHAITGGIIPENAAREQIKFILPTINRALLEGIGYKIDRDTRPPIDAIAVTYGPGLIGSLLVGVETAKTLSYIWNVPIIPINHMHGHIYANFIDINQNLKTKVQNSIEFPAIALVVSGGHTDLLLMKNDSSFEVIGGTRDDAAGEAFDKIGRLLGLPYPAGPSISKLAEKGDTKRFRLPRPMIGSKDFDFSFSGLKTSAFYLIKQNDWDFGNGKNEQLLSDLCASVQEAIVDVLVRKTIKAAVKYQARSILLGGGVAANGRLLESLELNIKPQTLNVEICVPKKSLCTDNGAMIAAAGFFQSTITNWQEITADPELYY